MSESELDRERNLVLNVEERCINCREAGCGGPVAVGICMGAEEAGWQGPSIMSIIYLALSVLALGLVAEKASRRSGMMYVEPRLTWSLKGSSTSLQKLAYAYVHNRRMIAHNAHDHYALCACHRIL